MKKENTYVERAEHACKEDPFIFMADLARSMEIPLEFLTLTEGCACVEGDPISYYHTPKKYSPFIIIASIAYAKNCIYPEDNIRLGKNIRDFLESKKGVEFMEDYDPCSGLTVGKEAGPLKGELLLGSLDLYFGKDICYPDLSLLEIRMHNQDNGFSVYKFEEPYTCTDCQPHKSHESHMKRAKSFADIAEISSDPRPYIHRMLELCAKMPKKDWHDPNIYNTDNTHNRIIEQAVAFLYADEKKAMLDRIQKAERRMHRLSLGLTRFPDPTASCFDYFLDHLINLKILDPKTGHQEIAIRISNSVMKNTDFPLGVEQAEKVLAKLKGVSNG